MGGTPTALGLVVPGGYDFPQMIMVGASDKEGRVGSLSNYGSDSFVDLFAPAMDIRALKNTLEEGRL